MDVPVNTIRENKNKMSKEKAGETKKIPFVKNLYLWGYSSVVKLLSSMPEALGSIRGRVGVGTHIYLSTHAYTPDTITLGGKIFLKGSFSVDDQETVGSIS